uniref:RNA exonuclease 4 n=1 Tax=Odontella aurita TaxID=265563 RepID=A0A7S4K680_9STRA|mmetsp:Transcript_62443/g.184729  ORF Transcript_62443/g.184729 Transcript_62443/m.184729 type:complete len:415 (+) Transcript_62443:265-1509(+)
MANFYMSKKAKADARSRKRRREKTRKQRASERASSASKGGEEDDGGSGEAGEANAVEEGNDGGGAGGGGGEAEAAAAASAATVREPPGLAGKALRKFRKDARRREREAGRDPAKLRFLAEGEELEKEKKAGKRKKGDDDGGDDDGQSNQSKKRPRKGDPKNGKKPLFPRINDLIAQDESRRAAEKSESARLQTLASVPPSVKSRYVALDCEMVGTGPGGKTSVLARTSLVGWDGEVLLDTFVIVPDRVTDFRTFVSGVRPEDIRGPSGDDGEGGRKGAMDPAECRRRVADLLDGKVLVGHGLKNDLKALFASHPRSDIRDTAAYRPFMRPGRGGGRLRPRKLRDLAAEYANVTVQGEGEAHSSVDDARAAMEVYKYARKRWEKDVEEWSRRSGGGGGRQQKRSDKRNTGAEEED